MIRLLDDALLASRAGAGELAEELIDFAEVVTTEVDHRRLADKPVDIIVTAPNTTVLGDRLALRRVVSNLIDNALIYGSVAHLSIIADEGPGIPPDQREQILEPFVRLEDSRNRRTGGAGLGLAVARSLVEAHAGTISIAEPPAVAPASSSDCRYSFLVKATLFQPSRRAALHKHRRRNHSG